MNRKSLGSIYFIFFKLFIYLFCLFVLLLLLFCFVLGDIYLLLIYIYFLNVGNLKRQKITFCYVADIVLSQFEFILTLYH